MPNPKTNIPWWLNESLDVVQRCFAREWDLLAECQRERFVMELGEAVGPCTGPKIPAWVDGKDDVIKYIRLAACQAAREIFGRML